MHMCYLSIQLLLTSGYVFWVCESDLDYKLYDGAAEEELKHEVIKGSEEELPVWSHHVSGLEVGAEELSS